MASLRWRKQWCEQRCAVVESLYALYPGGFCYPEAALIVGAILSALASELWPGNSIDKKRFIELLVTLGAYKDYCQRISVPLLIQHLQDNGDSTQAQSLRTAFGLTSISIVLSGGDIDASEPEILRVCPSLEITKIRKFSYAALLYSEMRSAYAHEYGPGKQAASRPMTIKDSERVSYTNRLDEKTFGSVKRLIHFHADWLLALSVDLSDAVDGLAQLPQQRPPAWWIDQT